MLLTESYRRQQSKLHSTGRYGNKGHTYAGDILSLARQLGTEDILDYGCGNGTLAQNLPFKIKQYDPCIPQFMALPEPADLVACTDVLEHIEPECIDAVLDDLKRVVKQMGFLAIDTRSAKKILDDGRNAHLIQERMTWWLPKLYERWSSVHIQDILYRPEKSLGFLAIVRMPRVCLPTNEGHS